jgi:hypothetical protein
MEQGHIVRRGRKMRKIRGQEHQGYYEAGVRDVMRLGMVEIMRGEGLGKYGSGMGYQGYKRAGITEILGGN